jgi:hypothetical protein
MQIESSIANEVDVGGSESQWKIQRRGSRGWIPVVMAAVLAFSCGFLPERATAAEAAEDSATTGLFDSEFSFALGGFFPRVSSTISLNSSTGGSGSDISTEDDLGLDSNTASAWVSFNWRFLPRHQFQAEWFALNRSGERDASREFTIGDTTVLVGAGLSSKVDINLGRVTYGYSIIRNARHDLSFLVGAHIVTAKATVTASGSIAVGGGPSAAGSSTESSSTFTFPLPHIGGQYSYKISQRWTMDLRLLGFAMEVDEFSGYLIEADALASYQLSKNFGIGTGLKYFDLNLQAQGSRGGAEYDFQFFGPAIFGYATF